MITFHSINETPYFLEKIRAYLFLLLPYNEAAAERVPEDFTGVAFRYLPERLKDFEKITKSEWDKAIRMDYNFPLTAESILIYLLE